MPCVGDKRKVILMRCVGSRVWKRRIATLCVGNKRMVIVKGCVSSRDSSKNIVMHCVGLCDKCLRLIRCGRT